MHTPAELRDRLLSLRIDRDLRTLTDWRQKGLLPPLQRVGGGRGRGVTWHWQQDLLDQAISIDRMITSYGTADQTLLALWLAGFSVDHTAARKAWIQSINRVQTRRQKAAKRYSGGYIGLARSWWKIAMRDPSALASWQKMGDGQNELFRQFLEETQEWMRDEDRDDAAYKGLISEVIQSVTRGELPDTYKQVETVWSVIDPPSLFAIQPYIAFVEAISLEQLSDAHRTLREVRCTIQHGLELFEIDRVNRVSMATKLVGDLIGTLIARTIISLKQGAPEFPVEQSILIVCNFVMSVKSNEIVRESGQIIHASDRVKQQWEMTVNQLRAIWA